MRLSGGQSGQALVGVLTVMVVLFALAGAVALAASELLTGRGQSRAAADDFQVRSAVSDSVAQLAGSTSRCWAPPVASPLPSSPSPTPSATPLQLALPGGATPRALCSREDAVVAGSVQRRDGAGTCFTLDLGQQTGRVAVLFDVRPTGSGWVYLDGGSQSSCSATPDLDSLPPTCWQVVGGGPVAQVDLSCNFQTKTDVRLHVNIPGNGPGAVFTATQNPSASTSSLGSVYLLASGTGVASPDYEESVLFVGTSGPFANRLLYEARLP